MPRAYHYPFTQAVTISPHRPSPITPANDPGYLAEKASFRLAKPISDAYWQLQVARLSRDREDGSRLPENGTFGVGETYTRFSNQRPEANPRYPSHRLDNLRRSPAGATVTSSTSTTKACSPTNLQRQLPPRTTKTRPTEMKTTRYSIFQQSMAYDHQRHPRGITSLSTRPGLFGDRRSRRLQHGR